MGWAQQQLAQRGHLHPAGSRCVHGAGRAAGGTRGFIMAMVAEFGFKPSLGFPWGDVFYPHPPGRFLSAVPTGPGGCPLFRSQPWGRSPGQKSSFVHRCSWWRGSKY